jgi:hypothetical protein
MVLNPNVRPDGTVAPVDLNPPPLNPEIVGWFQERRARLEIVTTTQTPKGQTLDWIPIESQVPGGKIASPPPPKVIPPDGRVTRTSFELEDQALERGPEGTVPVLRKNLDALHSTLPLNDYLNKRGGLVVAKTKPAIDAPLDPSTSTFFHAVSAQNTISEGCSTWLNVWEPFVEDSTGHSIMQLGLQNFDGVLQSLEAGWTVDHSLNGDWSPHLFVFYTTNAYTQSGDDQGGYNQDVDGWIQVSNTIYPGAGFTSVSVALGPQVGLAIGYTLFNNNWWFGVESNAQGDVEWIGYYPSWLFFGAPGDSEFTTLGARAEWVGFWGEVASTLSKPVNSRTEMGSGHKASGGWMHSCFQKNLQVTTPAGLIEQVGTASADLSAKYDIQLHSQSGTPWGTYFFAGGA